MTRQAIDPDAGKPDDRSRVAQTSVSWPDAITYSAQWSSWLLKNARDRLPRRDQAIGFVRLPAAAEGAVEVDIRGKKSSARLVKPPFVRRGKSAIET